MPGFLANATNITLQNVTDIGNSSSLPEFFIKVNHTIYNGNLWFVLLWVAWIILFITAQKVKDQPLNNAMYSGAVITVLSFLLRGVNMVIGGVVKGLLTDHQLWIFPLLTLVIVLIVWATK